MNSFTIKDLESLSGIKAHTIRIWEQRYSFLKPKRTDTNIRYYSDEELIKLLNIALLNKYGYKISHIDKMPLPEIEQKLISLNSAEAHAEIAVNKLVELMITMDVAAFEKQLDHHIRNKGIEKTISQLIFPFLEKIGILWVTSNINPAQEHLVSNIIRQKLIMGIESASPLTQSDRTALLYLPEGEHHELALLYLHYLLKTKGFRVYYLGSNVPLKDLVFVTKHKRPAVIYTHVTASPKGFNPEKYCNQFHSQLPDSKLIIGGPQVYSFQKAVPSNIKIVKSAEQATSELQSLLFNN